VTDEAVAWLRQQIESDLNRATMIPAGGYRPSEWRAELIPDDRLASLTSAIAAHAGKVPDRDGEEDPELWAAVFAWEKPVSERDCPAEWGDDLPVAIVQYGRNEHLHLAAYDPRFAAADCEAKLAILAACLPSAAAERAVENGDISTEEYAGAEACGQVILRHLASAYRHRPGYTEHWPTG
jgi:hypothetical protein